MNIVVALAVVFGGTGELYYTPEGAVEIERDRSVVVVGIRDRAALEGVVAREPGVLATHLFGDLYRFDGARDAALLLSRLKSAGLVTQELAPYRQKSNGQILIASDRILARFRYGSTEQEVVHAAKQVGAVRVELTRAREGLWVLYAPSAEDTVRMAARLQREKLAFWAHPDFIVKKVRHFTPDDPYFANQWHHELIGSTGAWESTRGSAAVTIAIIDSGTDVAHVELTGKAVSPRDALMGDNDPTPDATDAHGTATAGLAAAIGNNAAGVAGVCMDCSVMPIRIMSESGYGNMSADSDAFYWAADHGARILSNSWGYSPGMSTPSNLNQAILAVTEEGPTGPDCVVLFASGNEYYEITANELPSHPQVLGVGATTYWDRRFEYSNWGEFLDITAPAGSVTIDISGNNGYAFGDYMQDFGGTSAACPVAAGVVGLILSANPALTRGQVTSILYTTSDQIGDVNYTNNHHPEYGYGRVNALRAVQAALGGDVCQPVPEICDNVDAVTGQPVDDDCDYLANGDDPSCAPDETIVGAPCALDFECGAVGFCQTEDNNFVYPGGYCSAACEGGGCPGDATCVMGRFRGRCFVPCTARTDCREGYDCMQRAEGMVCVPSCTVSGCGVGETCDTSSGICVHDGPSPVGGACQSDVDCSDNGTCMTDTWGGQDWVTMPDGYCLVGCSQSVTCPEGAHCEDGGWRSWCVDSCQRNADCRPGYACWPNADGSGTCWLACQTNDDCEADEVCNRHHLCGALTPPVADPVAPPPEVCECDLTTECDDSCDCDPECDGGCLSAAVPGDGGALVLLALAPLTLVRRRRRGV